MANTGTYLSNLFIFLNYNTEVKGQEKIIRMSSKVTFWLWHFIIAYELNLYICKERRPSHALG